MYLKYGDYSHSIGEAAIIINKTSVLDDAGRKVGYKENWQISGMLEGTDSATLTTNIRALETAYGVNGRDLKLLNDDGSETAHKLINADSISGVQIETLNYPVGEGAEYTTFRRYTISAFADFSNLPGSGSDGTITFSQVITTRGTGGPRKVVLETRNGPPVVQYVSQRTPIYITQSGFAVGYISYPPPPAPIEPQWEDLEQREIRYEAPSVKSLVGIDSEYRISWNYSFSKPG
jgi:hypothetical protein